MTPILYQNSQPRLSVWRLDFQCSAVFAVKVNPLMFYRRSSSLYYVFNATVPLTKLLTVVWTLGWVQIITVEVVTESDTEFNLHKVTLRWNVAADGISQRIKVTPWHSFALCFSPHASFSSPTASPRPTKRINKPGVNILTAMYKLCQPADRYWGDGCIRSGRGRDLIGRSQHWFTDNCAYHTRLMCCQEEVRDSTVCEARECVCVYTDDGLFYLTDRAVGVEL